MQRWHVQLLTSAQEVEVPVPVTQEEVIHVPVVKTATRQRQAAEGLPRVASYLRMPKLCYKWRSPSIHHGTGPYILVPILMLPPKQIPPQVGNSKLGKFPSSFSDFFLLSFAGAGRTDRGCQILRLSRVEVRLSVELNRLHLDPGFWLP